MFYIFTYISFLKMVQPAKSSKRTPEPALYHRGIKVHGEHRTKSRAVRAGGRAGKGLRTTFQGPTLSCRLSAACWTGLGMSRSLGGPLTLQEVLGQRGAMQPEV